MPRSRRPFSAALCRGLIEDDSQTRAAEPATIRFPRLYAAASLKTAPPSRGWMWLAGFSAALCRGLIEETRREAAGTWWRRFSAALCRGLIEDAQASTVSAALAAGFPRLYAAASLKRDGHHHGSHERASGFPRLYAAASLKIVVGRARVPGRPVFSAALCRGLIEDSTR